MTDSAPTPADPLAHPHDGDDASALRREGAASRFGAAEHLLDRMDLRPLELRQHPRPWWHFWRWPLTRR